MTAQRGVRRRRTERWVRAFILQVEPASAGGTLYVVPEGLRILSRPITQDSAALILGYPGTPCGLSDNDHAH